MDIQVVVEKKYAPTVAQIISDLSEDIVLDTELRSGSLQAPTFEDIYI
jgi:hypothetical protein